MRKRICCLALTLGLLTVSIGSLAFETIRGTTELRYWDSANTYNGCTLFAGRETTYLIDMQGNLVNLWPIGTNPRFLENGHLLDRARDEQGRLRGMQEQDWEGTPVWSFYETRENYVPHHDFVRIYNKKLGAYTTLYIANKRISNEEALAAGANPENGPYDGSSMDAVVEIDMSGNVVWEWWFFDHMVQDIDPTKPNYVGEGRSISDYPNRLNLNLPGRPLRWDWLHCNSLDYNPQLDQIVINSVFGEFYVIDHGATFIPDDPAGSIAAAAGPAGDFLYRFGDPAKYDQGDPPHILEDWSQSSAGNKQIGGSHDIQWIRPGLQGEGNFLVFNNGQLLFERLAQSSILEINPYLNASGIDTGTYVNPPQSGYHEWPPEEERTTQTQVKLLSNQVVWIYASRSNQSFASHIGSGCQRLPNGNTLICAMTEGHIFEITSEGKPVWEYVSPVTTDGILKIITDNPPNYNAVFRAYRYGPDHPALAGRDLTGAAPITDLLSGHSTDGAWSCADGDTMYFQSYTPEGAVCLITAADGGLAAFSGSVQPGPVFQGIEAAGDGEASIRISFTSSGEAVYTFLDGSGEPGQSSQASKKSQSRSAAAMDGIWKSDSQPLGNFLFQSYMDGSAVLILSLDGTSSNGFS